MKREEVGKMKLHETRIWSKCTSCRTLSYEWLHTLWASCVLRWQENASFH